MKSHPAGALSGLTTQRLVLNSGPVSGTSMPGSETARSPVQLWEVEEFSRKLPSPWNGEGGFRTAEARCSPGRLEVKVPGTLLWTNADRAIAIPCRSSSTWTSTSAPGGADSRWATRMVMVRRGALAAAQRRAVLPSPGE